MRPRRSTHCQTIGRVVGDKSKKRGHDEGMCRLVRVAGSCRGEGLVDFFAKYYL